MFTLTFRKFLKQLLGEYFTTVSPRRRLHLSRHCRRQPATWLSKLSSIISKRQQAANIGNDDLYHTPNYNIENIWINDWKMNLKFFPIVVRNYCIATNEITQSFNSEKRSFGRDKHLLDELQKSIEEVSWDGRVNYALFKKASKHWVTKVQQHCVQDGNNNVTDEDDSRWEQVSCWARNHFFT